MYSFNKDIYDGNKVIMKNGNKYNVNNYKQLFLSKKYLQLISHNMYLNYIFKYIMSCKYIMELSQDESRIYEMQPEYKKATYQCEQWNNTLSNGKNVRYEITTFLGGGHLW